MSRKRKESEYEDLFSSQEEPKQSPRKVHFQTSSSRNLPQVHARALVRADTTAGLPLSALLNYALVTKARAVHTCTGSSRFRVVEITSTKSKSFMF